MAKNKTAAMRAVVTAAHRGAELRCRWAKKAFDQKGKGKRTEGKGNSEGGPRDTETEVVVRVGRRAVDAVGGTHAVRLAEPHAAAERKG